MNSPEESWWSVSAGEYVLGTLRGEDLTRFELVLPHDTEMRAEVARWERRLAPLNETARPQAPGVFVWPGVLEHIRRSNHASPATGLASLAMNSGEIAVSHSRQRAAAALRTSVSPVWLTLTGLATAASLVLALLLYQQADFTDTRLLRVDGLAVVLSDENGSPYFLVETDYGNLRVRVTALRPPSLDENRNFQLWQALPDRSAVRPVALLPEGSGRTRVFDVASLIEGSDLFGVSIEPEGAPTDAGPTGPVVAHGDFLLRTDEEI